MTEQYNPSFDYGSNHNLIQNLIHHIEHSPASTNINLSEIDFNEFHENHWRNLLNHPYSGLDL